ncbi:MAG: hypothetical protein HY940_04345 [Gammaproteobacteria bacterium]|nr:hypothetical protein [Gammaproteobacteria bacterium]
MNRWVMWSGWLALLIALPAQALEVDREVWPRLTLGGRVIGTLDLANGVSDGAIDNGVTIADSGLLLRLDKRLYQHGIGGAVLGYEDFDGAVRLTQANAFYWDRDIEVHVGAQRLRNELIEFPVLRDDDVLGLAHVGNAAADDEYGQFYGRLVAVDWYVDGRNQALDLWLGNREQDAGHVSAGQAVAGFNSVGLGYHYQQSNDLIYVERWRSAGIALDAQRVQTAAGIEEWMAALIAAADVNLNIDPAASWSLVMQAIYNDGITHDGVISTLSERARARSQSWVTALRYTARPNLLTRWQAALTVGYKEFPDHSDASQWTVIPTYVRLLGQGVAAVAQLKYSGYGAGLYQGGEDVAVQIGISYSLDARFNDTIGERNSILNLQYGQQL